MAAKYVAPSITEAFNCPHCGALAHQVWYRLYAVPYGRGDLPISALPDDFEQSINSDEDIDQEKKEKIISHYKKIYSGDIFINQIREDPYSNKVENLDLARCYSCNKFSVWKYGKMLYPEAYHAIKPNDDLPNDVKVDFEEAVTILSHSPRGSAALLRLCIQKLCKELGESGNNINSDIASLVKKGLDKRIQQALDVVRVIGNNAVHPGQIDLRDDQDIAAKLFLLVNMIADAMITQPKQVDELFASLPESVRDQIAKRDR